MASKVSKGKKGTQRKLSAILCADVVGYSRLMGDEYTSIDFWRLLMRMNLADSSSYFENQRQRRVACLSDIMELA